MPCGIENGESPTGAEDRPPVGLQRVLVSKFPDGRIAPAARSSGFCLLPHRRSPALGLRPRPAASAVIVGVPRARFQREGVNLIGSSACRRRFAERKTGAANGMIQKFYL